MQRNIGIILLLIIGFGVGIAAGVFGILWATGGNSTPSRDTADVAPTLSLDGPTPTPNALGLVGTEIASLNDKVDDISTQVDSLSSQLNDIASGVMITSDGSSDPSMEETPAPTDEPTEADIPERALYRITEDESEVRFLIDETLAGNPTTVVGTTRRVAGDVIVNFQDPPASQVGTIAINARTLRTDTEFRDQSIRGQILQSAQDEFEFINFVPTELIALSQTPVGVGGMIDFQIVGDLTIRDVTRSVTFDASVTVESEARIFGFASTVVLYEDFGLTINAPPNVADIGDEVILEIDFVALRVEE